eukprot:scaffold48102_cov29-Attheya_sp.AAC.1
MSDFDFKTRVGKAWTRRIQTEQFEVFLSNYPGRNGDKPQEISGGTQGKSQRGKETRTTSRDR